MYRKYLSDYSLNTFLTSWNLSSKNNSVVFIKGTARSIAFYLSLKNGNQRLIKENILVHFWQIYQKPSIVFLRNLYLQNYMCMVSFWEHQDSYIVTSLTENNTAWKVRILLAREHVSTWARKYAKHISTWARKYQGTLTREHLRHVI